MTYLDTSVAVCLLANEIKSSAVVSWMNSSNDSLVACDWIQPEFASALSIKLRQGHITASQRKTIQAEFDSFTLAGLRLSPVTREMFIHAAQLVAKPTSPLRAGDALHLAAAIALGAKTIATLDQNLAKYARQANITVIDF